MPPRPRPQDGLPRSRYHPLSLLNRVSPGSLGMLIPLASTVFLIWSSPDSVPARTPLRVLPIPPYFVNGEGKTPICLAQDFSIRVEGNTAPDDLKAAIRRTEKSLVSMRHRYLSVQRGREFFGKGNSTGDIAGCRYELGSLVLYLTDEEATKSVPSIFDSAIRPVEDRPELETYSLAIPLREPAHIKAKTALGLFRGLTTFEQLFYHLPLDSSTSAGSVQSILSQSNGLEQSEQLPLVSGLGSAKESTSGEGQDPAGSSEGRGRIYAPLAPYEIEDKPSFGWRAVLLDTSRHYFGIPSILKVCGPYQESVKMNSGCHSDARHNGFCKSE